MGSRDRAAFTLLGGCTFSHAMPKQETSQPHLLFAEGLAQPSPEHGI